MSKTKIRVEKPVAEQKLKGQMEKGKQLAEKAMQILRETSAGTDQRTHGRDNFQVLYEQWVDFTEETLFEVFVSGKYARDFKDKQSSKKQYVGSGWIPTVGYYLEHKVLPKLEYLDALTGNLDQFEKASVECLPQVNRSSTKCHLKLPERVTLSWLWRHVPIRFWLWLVSLVIAAFIIGVTVGQISWVQEFFNKK